VVVEAAIAEAVAEGWMRDIRDSIQTANERYDTSKYNWPKRLLSEVLGQCTHHNASKNTSRPENTAGYHTSKKNHITPGRPLPSIVYPICTTSTGEVLITGSILDRTYGQAAPCPGDENLHLVPVLVMGGFDAPGYRGHSAGPTEVQTVSHTKVCQWLAELAGFGPKGNFYHAHFGKASCPGYALMKKIDGWRNQGEGLITALDWQQALLRWDPDCLPKYGADGDWGRESRYALTRFQRHKGMRATKVWDPFTELILLRDYPDPNT
jgi:hypothetical protein